MAYSFQKNQQKIILCLNCSLISYCAVICFKFLKYLFLDILINAIYRPWNTMCIDVAKVVIRAPYLEITTFSTLSEMFVVVEVQGYENSQFHVFSHDFYYPPFAWCPSSLVCATTSFLIQKLPTNYSSSTFYCRLFWYETDRSQ